MLTLIIALIVAVSAFALGAVFGDWHATNTDHAVGWCDCGWTSRPYSTERGANAALRQHRRHAHKDPL